MKVEAGKVTGIENWVQSIIYIIAAALMMIQINDQRGSVDIVMICQDFLLSIY